MSDTELLYAASSRVAGKNVPLLGDRQGGGIVGNRWDPTLKRYFYRVDATSDAFHRGDNVETKIPSGITFFEAGMPDHTLFIHDQVVVTRAGVSQASAFVGWARRSVPTSQNMQFPESAIGFRSQGTGTANWKALVTDPTVNAPVALIEVDLGVADNVLHELELRFNGADDLIEWWIDGVKKHSAALPAGYTAEADDGGDPQHLIEVRVDSPAHTISMDLDAMGAYGGLVGVSR